MVCSYTLFQLTESISHVALLVMLHWDAVVVPEICYTVFRSNDKDKGGYCYASKFN